MAFHMACPITCQKICYCTLGFPGPLQSYQGKRAFLEEVDRLEVLLSNPELLAAGGRETVEVLVPKVSISRRDYTTSSKKSHGGVGDADDDRDDRLSTQTKQMAMRRRAATLASLAADDYSRRLEQGDFTGAYPEGDLMRPRKHKGTHIAIEEAIKRNALQEETGSLLPKTLCRICLYGEDEGTKKYARMLSCKSCDKKYHRSCLKHWAENRDLFNWASWICPSCVSCEVCKRYGDPNKLMFCKRCDVACHSYCQHPPHKNVTPGPYLCPKHTWCHSCGSTVPGSGLSTRWFLGYTSCDACGRLFIKGKYCPICLKVYRDSEATPMVCCDACERWVHCVCDGISEEKYQQFQADGNLYYKCAACRGDCYQVKDLDDAVQELWRRRDETEQEQMTKLRAAAGLPSQQEMIHLCPSSDDDEEFPSIQPKDSKSISKVLAEKTFKSGKDQMMKPKEYGKKASKNVLVNKKIVKKKGLQVQSNGKTGALNNSFHIFQSEMKVEENSTPSQDQNSLVYENNEEEWSQKSDGNKLYSPLKTASSVKDGISVEADDMILKSNVVESGLLSDKKNAKGHKSKSSSKSSHIQMHEKVDTQTEKFASKSESSKRTKIVIHLPARDKNNKDTGKSCHRSASEAHSSQMEEGSAGSQGILPIHSSEIHSDNKRQHLSKHQDTDSSWGKFKKSLKGQKAGSNEGGKLTSLGMGKQMAKDEYKSSDFLQEAEVNLPSNAPVAYKAQRNKVGSFEGLPANGGQDEDSSESTRKQLILSNLGSQTGNHANETSGVVDNLSYKRSLKVKFKKPSFDKVPWVQRRDEDEGSLIKGQRSKRKRPHAVEMEKQEKEDTQFAYNANENTVNKILDDNWILMKLGKDAVGKRVEVYQPFDNTWHKGSVIGMGEQPSAFIVHLDDSREETIELGKQSVRFISQNKKKPRT